MQHPNEFLPSRLHKLSMLILEVLESVIESRRHADKELQTILRSHDFEFVEREFVVEVLFDMLRNFRLLQAAAQTREYNHDLFSAWLALRNYTTASVKNLQDLKKRITSLSTNRAMRYSYPDWLDAVGVAELGERRWEREMSAQDEPAQAVIRTNLLKTSREQLLKTLKNNRFEAKPFSRNDCGIILPTSAGIFRTDEFQLGHFEMQDASSQMVSPLTGVKPGMRVIDACAGAGGKTLHLAQLMKNKGRIIALDTSEKKLEDLKKRAIRAGVSIVETRTITSTKIIKRLIGKADVVLIDAPCSGLGVLRRNPETKYQIEPAWLDSLRAKQAEILASYSRMTAPKGTLVYTVCSILKSEGEDQVQKFIAEHPDFTLEKEQRFSPADDLYDGFYVGVMKRSEEVKHVKDIQNEATA